MDGPFAAQLAETAVTWRKAVAPYAEKAAKIFWQVLEKAKLGRISTHSPTAEARRSVTHKKPVEALKRWNPAELPKWFDEEFYRRGILPRLSTFTVKAIRLVIDVSHPYATLIKRGDRIPHPRHWLSLAILAGVKH